MPAAGQPAPPRRPPRSREPGKEEACVGRTVSLHGGFVDFPSQRHRGAGSFKTPDVSPGPPGAVVTLPR